MSAIDERIVEMRFENKDFERNVEKSLGTIEKLKSSLDFEDTVDSFGDLEKSLKHFSLDDIGNALDTLQSKVSATGVAVASIVKNITDDIYHCITGTISKITSHLELDKLDSVTNMLQGWGKYAEKTTAVQTIMAATASQFEDTGTQMEYVNAQLDKLNWFTDETSYDFVEMVGNIGKFTSNGIALDSAVTSMQGIANWAAISGQNAQTASRAMYNLSQAIGTGSVKLIDWRSIENANMATVEFKQTTMDAAVAQGTLTKAADGTYKTLKGTTVTVQDFNTALSEGWFNKAVLTDVLDKYGSVTNKLYDLSDASGLTATDILTLVESQQEGKLSAEGLSKALEEVGSDMSAEELQKNILDLASAENEFGIKTFKAAQEAKTFSDAMSALADAVSTGWMKSFELIFGDYETARHTWTDFANDLYDIFAIGGEDRNSLLSEANNSGWDLLASGIEKAGYSVEQYQEQLKKAAKVTDEEFNAIIKEAGSLEAAIQGGAFSKDILSSAIDGLAGIKKTLSGVTKEASDGSTYLQMSLKDIDDVAISLLNGKYGGYAAERIANMIAAGYTEEQAKMLQEYAVLRHENHGGKTQWNPEEAAKYLSEYADKVVDVNEALDENSELTDEQREALKAYLDEIDKKGAQESFLIGLGNIMKTVVSFTEQARDAFKEVFPPATAQQLRSAAEGFANVTGKIRKFVEDSGIVGKAVKLILAPIKLVTNILKGLLSVVGPIFNILKYVGSFVYGKVMERLAGPIKSIKDSLSKFSTDKMGKFNEFLEKIRNSDAEVVGQKIVNGLKDAYHWMGDLVSGPFKKLSVTFKKFKMLTNSLSYNKDISKLQAGFKVLSFMIEKTLKKFVATHPGLQKVLSHIKAIVSAVSTKLSPVWSKFTGMFTNIGPKFTEIANKFKTFKESITELANSKGIPKWRVAFETIWQSAKDAFSKIKETAKNTFSSIGDWLSGIGFKIPSFEEISASIQKFVDTAKQKISEIFDGSNIDFGKILSGAGIASLTVLLGKLFSVIIGSSKDAESNSVAGVLDKILGPLPDTMKTLREAIGGFNVLEFAAGLAVLAWAMSKFAEIDDTEKLKNSLISLGAGLAGFIGGFALITKIAGKKGAGKMLAAGLSVLAIAIALKTFVKALQMISDLEMSPKKLAKMAIGIVAAITTFRMISKAVGKARFSFTNGMSLIAMAVALRLFAGVLNSYTKLKISRYNIAKVLAGLLFAIVTFRAIAKVVGKSNFKFTNGMALVAFGLALLEFAAVVSILGKMDYGIMVQGLKGVVVLIAALALVLQAIMETSKGMNIRNGIGSLVLLVGFAGFLLVALPVLIGAVYLLGKMPLNVLKQGGIAMLILLTALTAVVAVVMHSVKSVGIGKAIGAVLMLITLAVLIGELVAVMMIFSGLSAKQIIKGLSGIGGIIIALFAIAAVMKHSNPAKLLAGAVFLIAFAGSLYLFGIALEKVAKLDLEGVKHGLYALGALLLGFIMFSGLIALVAPFAIALGIAAGIIAGFGIALQPVVDNLSKLAKMDPGAVSANLESLAKEIGLFFEVAGKLVADPGLFTKAKDAANLVKQFGESLKPLCDDTAILGGTDPTAAAGSLQVAKDMIQLMWDLADKLVSQEGMYQRGESAAYIAKSFGESLKPLCDDVAILGGANATKAAESVTVVQSLIDLMFGVAETLIGNTKLYQAGIDAATVAGQFGTGLKDLCNDVKTLGEVKSTDAAAGSVPVVQSLIDLMVNLGNQLVTDQSIFENADSAAAVASSFGTGLSTLCDDVALLGSTSSADATANLENVLSLITKMEEIADKINSDAGYFDSSLSASESVKAFGKALLLITAEAWAMQYISPDSSGGGFTAVTGIIDKMLEYAQKFNDNASLYESALEAAEACKAFGTGLAGLTAEAFVNQFINPDASTDGFGAVTTIIDEMVDLAGKFSGENGSVKFAGAKKAAEACKSFAQALVGLIAEEFVASLGDAQSASSNLDVVYGMIDKMYGYADTLSGNKAKFVTAKLASKNVADFGKALREMVITEFLTNFTNADKAEKNFGIISTMLNDMETLATLIQDSAFAAAVPAAIQAIRDTSGALSSFNGPLQDLGFISKSSVESIGSAFSTIVAAISELAGVKDGDLASAGKALEGLGLLVSGIGDLSTVTGVVNKDTKFIGENAISGTIDSLITNINNKMPEIEALGTNLYNAIFKGMSGTSETGASTTDTDYSELIIQPLLTTFEEANESFSSAGEAVMASVLSGIESVGTSSVTSSLRNMMSVCQRAIRQTRSGFYSAGQYIIQGFVDGLYSMIGEAEAAVNRISELAQRAMEESNKIKSPSKVYYEYGRYVVMGFVKGIEENEQSAVDSMTNMSTNMTDTVSAILSTIDANVDLSPTITPVLDMTNIQNGSGMISRMLSGTRNLSVSASTSMAQNAATSLKDNTSALSNQVGKDKGTTYSFVQNNYSPKALNRIDIYRQTKNQFAQMKGAIDGV